MSRPSGCVIGGTGYSHVNIDNIVAKMRDLKLSELISDASWDGGHEVYNYFNKL